MKFTVNGNEIEIYKDKIEIFYDYSIEYGDIHCRSYYIDIIIINVNNGEYELEIFEYDLLEAILSLENMETFKEFVESYNAVKIIRANEELKQKKIKSELENNEHLAMEESKEVEFTPMRGFGKKFK